MSVSKRRKDLTDDNHDMNECKESSFDCIVKTDREKEENRALYTIFISLIIDLLAFTLILPLFPSLIAYYRMNDSSGLFDYCENRIEWFRVLVGAPTEFNTVLFGGLLGSLFSMLQFLASPIIGGLSDR